MGSPKGDRGGGVRADPVKNPGVDRRDGVGRETTGGDPTVRGVDTFGEPPGVEPKI